MSVFNVYSVYLLPFFDDRPVSGFLLLSGLAAAAAGCLYLYYEKRVAVKKQPDLDIPCALEADEAVDFIVRGEAVRKKIQINGDTRDAFILGPGEEVELTLLAKARNIKFAVGVRELSGQGRFPGTGVKVFEKKDGSERILLYAGHMDPSGDHNARNWAEVDLELPAGGEERERSIVVSADPRDRSVKDGPERSLCFAGPRISGRSAPRKIILIVLDAVRADHVGCYGYARGLTPNIDELAGAGTRFSNAIVQGEWTLPSFMSMLTGMYPSAHHVYHHTRYHSLDKKVRTLPGVLRKNGFMTRSYFTHKRLMSHFGFARGFDSHLFRQCDKQWNTATADDVTDRALDMLEFHKHDDLFLMAHYFDTHQPCDPPSPYSGMFDKLYGSKVRKNVRQVLLEGKGQGFDEKDLYNLIARYDAEIFKVDLKVGIIVDHLKRTGQYDDAMIIVTADHGMLLNDHGSLTRITLFDETVRVPFIVKYPGPMNIEKGARVE
ncbi:MAG: sulfatase, partial [Candidatus Omnitrophica bacterium]|nr:sulfatase [Candidatus Omnitrophota bacterium]